MERYVALMDGDNGHYGVTFPDLPGCVAMGRSVDDALRNAAESLRDWVDVVESGHGATPSPRTPDVLRKEPEFRDAVANGAILAFVPLMRGGQRPVKANLSLDPGVLSLIDAASRARGVTRSAMVEILAMQSLPDLV